MAKAKAKSKKSTKSAAKKVTFQKQTPAHYKAVAAAMSKGKLPETSGEAIRALVVAGKPTDEIVKTIKAKFKGSKVKASDVYWNRGRLKKEGIKLAA